jgi:hypothetical protein
LGFRVLVEFPHRRLIVVLWGNFFAIALFESNIQKDF